MPIVAFGINLEHFEKKRRWAETFEITPQVLNHLARAFSCEELFLVKRSNEFAVFAVSERRNELINGFYQFLQNECRVTREKLQHYGWRREGAEAVRQFLKYAIGLDCPGDLAHSIEQFRKCFAVSKATRLAGPYLNKLYIQGIWLSEKVRLELNLHKNMVTPESVVTDLAEKIFGDLKDHQALILNGGPWSESFINKLQEKRIGKLYFLKDDQSIELAQRYNGFLIETEEMPALLRKIDLIINFSLGKLDLFKSSRLHQIMGERHNAPLLIVDYPNEQKGNPIENTQVSRIYNLYFYNKDDLQQIITKNLKEHLKVVESVDQLIEREVRDFLLWVQNKELYRFGDIIGKSEAMQNILELIARVAQTDTTILIDGESGTGKELIARSIHAHSTRAKNPFVVVNCGAMPENLLESELFGHVRGAFTGAMRNKKGLFEVANQGTIFLDEIGETSFAMQVKLLRFLQEGEIKPVGSNETIKLDVRLIAATNRQLEDMVEQGTFRKDLFYRLNVIKITIPPLRERKEDILPLAEFFIKKFATKMHKTVYGMDEEVAELLQQYHWPGNVRELENAMEHAVALSSGDLLTRYDLPSSIVNSETRLNGKLTVKTMSLRELEKQYISQMLKEYNWNYELVTKILGIGRTTLWRKMKEYNLSSKSPAKS